MPIVHEKFGGFFGPTDYVLSFECGAAEHTLFGGHLLKIERWILFGEDILRIGMGQGSGRGGPGRGDERGMLASDESGQ